VIFDDVKNLAMASNPNAFAMIEQTEQGMNLSLKNDLLSQFTGEITLELESVAPRIQFGQRSFESKIQAACSRHLLSCWRHCRLRQSTTRSRELLTIP